MKKAIVITLTLSILLLLCACSADQKHNPSVLKPDNEQTQLAVPDSVGEGTKKEDTSGYAEERFVSANFDYVFTDLNDICENADLVIRGVCLGDRETALSSGGLPLTTAEFEVVEVVKGSFEGETIGVSYYGGTVSMFDYMNAMGEEERAKAGYDFTEEEAKKIGVTYMNEENGVSFKEGTEYLVCLGANDDGTYMVLAEGYGVSAVEDGQVTNRATGEKIPLEELGN